MVVAGAELKEHANHKHTFDYAASWALNLQLAATNTDSEQSSPSVDCTIHLLP